MLMALFTPGMLPDKVASKTESFTELMKTLFSKRYELTLPELTEYLIDATGYCDYLKAQDENVFETRRENIDELLGAMQEHVEQLNEGDDALQSFLETVALNSEADNVDESDGTVKLMTLHCAKGLEFPVVFMPGMEDHIFPSYQSKDDPSKLEEERRLCYVGVTRAEERLFLYAARERFLYGSRQYNDPSIFLEEMGFVDSDTPMKRNSFGSAKDYGNGGGYGNFGGGRHYGSGGNRSDSYGYGFNGGGRNYKAGTAYGNSYSKKESSSGSPVLSDEVINAIRKINGIGSAGRAEQKPFSYEYHESREKASPETKDMSAYKKFALVDHEKFGRGRIVDISGSGTTIIVTVDFDTAGRKRIAAAYAPMKVIKED